MGRRLTTVAAVVLVVGACSEQAFVYEPSEVERQIAELAAGEGIGEVECVGLADLDPEIGGVVDCLGTLDQDLVDLSAEVVPSSPVPGETLAVDVEVLTPLFDVTAATVAAEERLAAELGGNPQIECPLDTVVLVPTRRVECRVTAEGGTAGPVDRPVTIVLIGAEGDFEVRLFE